MSLPQPSSVNRAGEDVLQMHWKASASEKATSMCFPPEKGPGEARETTTCCDNPSVLLCYFHDHYQDMLELEAEHDQDLQSKQDEQETHDAQCEDPHLSTSLQSSENIPKL